MKKLKSDGQKEVLGVKFFLSSFQDIPRSHTTHIDKTYCLAYNENQSWMRYGHNTRLYCHRFPANKQRCVSKRYNPMIVIGGLNFWRLKFSLFPVSALRKNNLKRQLEQMIAIKNTLPIMRNQKSVAQLSDWGRQNLSIQEIKWQPTKYISSYDIPGRSTFV